MNIRIDFIPRNAQQIQDENIRLQTKEQLRGEMPKYH